MFECMCLFFYFVLLFIECIHTRTRVCVHVLPNLIFFSCIFISSYFLMTKKILFPISPPPLKNKIRQKYLFREFVSFCLFFSILWHLDDFFGVLHFFFFLKGIFLIFFFHQNNQKFKEPQVLFLKKHQFFFSIYDQIFIHFFF